MIGIFDSGLGGLIIVKELLSRYSDLDFVYLGDTERYPYGNKSQEMIKKYARQDVEFLLKKGATLIIIACNTATSLAGDYLKHEFPEIDFVNVIDPVVEDIAQSKINRLGVIGTRATISSNVYERKILNKNKDVLVFSKACPLFVPLVEEGFIDHQITKIVARKYLTSLRQKNIESLVLGCTHYPFLESIIQRKVGRNVKIINSAKIVIDYAEKMYKNSFIGNKKQYFYFTDLSYQTNDLAKKWLGGDIDLRKTSLF